MSLDPSKLERPRARGGKAIARCPVCAVAGADKSCEHLWCASPDWDGPFGCLLKCDKKEIFALVGVTVGNRKMLRPLAVVRSARVAKLKPQLPDLRPLTTAEMDGIANQRGWLCITGMKQLSQRGLLWFANVRDNGTDWPAWLITDASRRNAQARRLDGKEWSRIAAKAKTLPGCEASWPIGAADIGCRPIVLLVEGGPDLLASLYCVGWESFTVEAVAPVCMAGAGHSIPADALPLFAGKHVRICPHNDAKGMQAGERWVAQLYRAGAARVSRYTFEGLKTPDGEPGKDLADFARLYDSGERPDGPSLTTGL